MQLFHCEKAPKSVENNFDRLVALKFDSSYYLLNANFHSSVFLSLNSLKGDRKELKASRSVTHSSALLSLVTRCVQPLDQPLKLGTARKATVMKQKSSDIISLSFCAQLR